jgi:hypothetical protein
LSVNYLITLSCKSKSAYIPLLCLQAIDVISAKRSHVLWTLQEPVNTEKLHPARAMITNEQIDMYNKAAMEVMLLNNQIPDIDTT